MKYEDFGIVVQAVGPIIDVRFVDSKLPNILTALVIPIKENEELVVEIEQYVGDDTARCVAMGPTEGIVSNAIYFVPCENADGDDMYDEYVYINGQWERQGTRDSAIETIESAKATSSEIDELFK